MPRGGQSEPGTQATQALVSHMFSLRLWMFTSPTGGLQKPGGTSELPTVNILWCTSDFSDMSWLLPCLRKEPLQSFLSIWYTTWQMPL